jgi:[ribosomal protein S5]-alanine N-acetyltransferase
MRRFYGPLTPERAQILNASLASNRLQIDPLRASDAEELFTALQDPALYQWISSTRPVSVEQLRTRYEARESRLSPHGEMAWLNWVLRSKQTHAVLGRMDAEVDDHNVAHNIGYVLISSAWGQGCATEAVQTVLRHFQNVGIHTVRATVTVGNHASARVLEKCGFRYTDTLLNNDTIRGALCDDLAYEWVSEPQRS